MKLKKHIKDKNKTQVWRILVSNTDKLLIESRDFEKKEAYFTCYNIETSKNIFKNLPLIEKYWIGVEEVFNDFIYFHKYAKPDMPGHKSIIAYDINLQKVVWQNDKYSFLFIFDDKIYCYEQKFEGRHFYTLDPLTGEILETYGNDVLRINEIKRKSDDARNYENYYFSDSFNGDLSDIPEEVKTEINNLELAGNVDFIEFGNILAFNFHYKLFSGLLENKLIVYDKEKKKKLLSEIINSSVKNYVPDSFFIYKKYLLMLKEKKEVYVYKIE